VGNQTFSATGNYSVNLQTSAGCDSLVNLFLTVNPSIITTLDRTVCQGSNVTVGGQIFSTTGNYSVSLQANAGCDSIVNLSLTVNPLKTTALSQTICQGSSVIVGNQTFTNTGNYSVLLQSSVGCDSTVNLSLSVDPTKATSIRQTICEGQAVTVGGQAFPNSGIYVVPLQTSKGCDSIVTLDLTVNPQLLVDVSMTASKTNICEGDLVSFQAQATNPGNTPVYQWYLNGVPVGTNSPLYSNSNLDDSDVVWVQLVSSEICVLINPAVSQQVGISVSRVDYKKPVIEYCSGESALIDLEIPQRNYTIIWNNRDNTQTTTTDQLQVSNSSPGYVGFTIQHGNGCEEKDSIFLQVNNLPLVNAQADKLLVKYGVQVQLDAATGPGIIGYNWTTAAQLSDPAIKNPTTIISNPAWYSVLVTDANGCRNSDSVFVNMFDECMESFVFVPNGFSPNRDGVNDCFGVLYAPSATEYKLVIFNRWGEKLFETTDISGCWDGTYKGAEAMVDSYSYVIGFRCYNGKFITKKGVITLLR
jgi:gliding motility-associated-like protein